MRVLIASTVAMFASILLLIAPTLAVADTAMSADAPGFCTVRVYRVAPVDAAGTVQGVTLRATVPGSATLSGTIALFTEDDRRYDVPFRNTLVSNTAPSQELRYRFVHAVKITGAYVASLDQPSPGACEVAIPWKPERSYGAKDVPPQPPADALDVDGDGAPAPRSCAKERFARTISAARPAAVLGFNGRIVVDLTLGADDRIISTGIQRVQTDPATSKFAIEAAERSALAATNASTFQTGTFRCEPVIDEFNFIVLLNAPP